MASHKTRIWRERERSYRRRLWAALAVSVAVHLLLAFVFEPIREYVPLVRHIGYAGQLRILPEISVLREPGEQDSEAQAARRGGAESLFRVVPIEIVEWSVPSAEDAGEQTGETAEDAGDDELDRHESSPPQPRSDDVIVTYMVKPLYPSSSFEAGIEGDVVYQLRVTKTGSVARAWLVSSEVDAACDQAAYRAVMEWEFMPYLVGGSAVDIVIPVRVEFRLEDAGFAAPRGGTP